VSPGGSSSDCSINHPRHNVAWRSYHLQRTRFELAVELKLRRRQLSEDGNVEITGRDLRERDQTPAYGGADQARAYEAR
jgi:hypothetical protein